MTWLELDDRILEHPKFIRAIKLAGAESLHLWLGIRAYCGQNLTDGFIPEDMLDEVRGPIDRRRRAAALSALKDVGLLEAAEGGLQMHDFLDWSSSREQVLSRRAAARDRKDRSRGLSRRDGERTDGVTASERTVLVRVESQTPAGGRARVPLPSSAPPSPEEIPPSPPVGGKPAAPANKPRRAKVRPVEIVGELVAFPEPFVPTAAHRAFAAKHGLDVELEATACKGHYAGQKVASPDGRFTTWLGNQARWKQERRPPPGAVQHRNFERTPAELPGFDANAAAARINQRVADERAENERRQRAAQALREASGDG